MLGFFFFFFPPNFLNLISPLLLFYLICISMCLLLPLLCWTHWKNSQVKFSTMQNIIKCPVSLSYIHASRQNWITKYCLSYWKTKYWPQISQTDPRTRVRTISQRNTTGSNNYIREEQESAKFKWC